MYPDDVAGLVLVDPTPDSEQGDQAAAGLLELESLADTLNQARASRVPTGIPVLLIDAVSPVDVPFATEAIRLLRMSNRADLEVESEEYKKWLATIPGSRLIVANSGHNVAQEQPDLVVASIRRAVEESKRKRDP
jgi:pimeloyl-ACP methyl ester carboxylesterase